MNIKIQNLLLQTLLLGSIAICFVVPSYGMQPEREGNRIKKRTLRQTTDHSNAITSFSSLERKIKRSIQKEPLESVLRKSVYSLVYSHSLLFLPKIDEDKIWGTEKGYFSTLYNIGWFMDKIKKTKQSLFPTDEVRLLLEAARAFYWWQRSQNQSDPEAWYELGKLYNIGEGVEKDYAEAMKWYLKAANQNDAAAQRNIGILYHNGEGIEKDYKKAFEWYLKGSFR